MKESVRTQFEGRTLVIATKHAKERVIAPLLEEALGVRVVVPEDFDSDQFGTFTGSVKRAGNQLEAARAKAQKAMKETGADLGLASEGSFGSHPQIPFVNSNLELILLVDSKHNTEYVGHFHTMETVAEGDEISSPEEAVQFAESVGFPEQGVILKQKEGAKGDLAKDFDSVDMLKATVQKELERSKNGTIFIESDQRAHQNPTRMKAIELATKRLLEVLASTCPNCEAPGFWIDRVNKGLPCELCGNPTDLPKEEVFHCQECTYEEARPVESPAANPRYCGYCNP